MVLRLTAVPSVRDAVSFDYQMFFNLLLPPIILSAGYELHQVSRTMHDSENCI
jgi:sodium/hydrogen exchanger-like protein 6/7